MFHCHRIKPLLNLNILSQISSSTPKCHLFLQPISLSIFFSTTSEPDQQQSFTISYLTKHCGFSPQAALRASKRVRFGTAQKPDKVIAFFREQGFSFSQIQSVIIRVPQFLTCNPIKRVLPKFEFFASKGSSASDIVTMVTKRPGFLGKGLQKCIIPAYELVRRFSPSDARALELICIIHPCYTGFQQNVKLLLDVGVTQSNIRHLLGTKAFILCSSDIRNVVEEVKGLGFDPLKVNFVLALQAKKATTKSKWDAKVDTFKRWGFSEDAILQSFRRYPKVMLCSKDKLNAVMSFWVGQLGWDSSGLQAAPILFGFSLEKRIIPRASVIQYLLSKGLMKKGASLVKPFSLSEKLFLQRYVTCFGEEETSKLLKLYQGQGGC